MPKVLAPLLVIAVGIVCAIILVRFSLTEQVHAKIRAQLDARKAESAAAR